MKKKKRTNQERQAWAEDHPTVKLLRELAAKIDVELAEKRAAEESGRRA